jgi:hypothetical protein
MALVYLATAGPVPGAAGSGPAPPGHCTQELSQVGGGMSYSGGHSSTCLPDTQLHNTVSFKGSHRQWAGPGSTLGWQQVISQILSPLVLMDTMPTRLQVVLHSTRGAGGGYACPCVLQPCPPPGIQALPQRQAALRVEWVGC